MKMKLSKKIAIAVMSLVVLFLPVCIFTLQAATDQQCWEYCVGKYGNPLDPVSMVFVMACYDGCTNEPT